MKNQVDIEKNDEKKEPFQVDDFKMELNKGDESSKIAKYCLILGIAFFILFFIIAFILMSKSDITSEDEIQKKIVGDINSIFEIKTTKDKTSILGKEFEKKSDFSIIIDGKRIKDFITEYLFNEPGEHKIKFELHEDINMDFMFENIINLKSIDMNSNSSAKIYSMKSIFEKCHLLNSFNIEGFDTKNITSLK